MIGFSVTGLEGVEQALRELKRATAKRVVRKVLTDALEPVAETARRLAPFDEGDLHESIVTGTKLNRSARRGARPDTETQVTVYVGTANRNAVPREFGSARSAAHPFLRPAWDTHRAQVLAHILENLAAEISKAVQRARARGGRS